MDETLALAFCHSLLEEKTTQRSGQATARALPIGKRQEGMGMGLVPPPQIKREDLDALINYVKLWTDTISIDDVTQQFAGADLKSAGDFKSLADVNHLTNVGFFYVKVNTELSVLEFFNLLSKIPWENIKELGLDQVSYATIAQLFGSHSEQIAIQLMVLGSHCHFWKLINPYTELTQTPEITRLLISGNGTLSIYIEPNFINHCQDLIDMIKTSA
jgi:hypothetical protein